MKEITVGNAAEFAPYVLSFAATGMVVKSKSRRLCSPSDFSIQTFDTASAISGYSAHLKTAV